MQNDVKASISRLHYLIASEQRERLPYHVRFRTRTAYHALAVTAIQPSEVGIEAVLADGSSTVFIKTELIDVVAFEDALGRPVFLWNYQGESAIAADMIDDREQSEMRLHCGIMKWQNGFFDIAHGGIRDISDGTSDFYLPQPRPLDDSQYVEELENLLDFATA